MLAITPVEFNFLETLPKNLIIPARQNFFIHEHIPNDAPVRRIAIVMNKNSAFTQSYTANTFWYQLFDLRQVRILRGCQQIVDSDAADNCHLFIKTRKSFNFQDDIPLIPIDNFKDHFILVFDLTSMQDATESNLYPELVEGPLRLELFFYFSSTKRY